MSKDPASPRSPGLVPSSADAPEQPTRVQANSAPGPCARSFERSHWEWAFEQARDAGRAFSCAVMVIDNVDGIEAAQRDDWVRGFLVDLERLIDERKDERRVLFGVEASCAYLALLDCDAHEAGRFAGEIIRATYPLTGFLPSPKPGLSVGIASNRTGDGPVDGNLFLETLLRVASEGAEVAVAGGGGRWVHTELYGLVQRRLESRAGAAHEVEVSVAEEAETVEPSSVESPQLPPPVARAEPVAAPEPVSDASAPNGSARPKAVSGSEQAPDPALSPPREEPSEEVEPGWREIRPRRSPREASWRADRSSSLDLAPVPAGGLMELLLRALGQAGLSRAEAVAAESALLPILSEYVEAERARSLEESRSRVQLLERRIRKLRGQLEGVQRAQPQPLEENGLASTFRAVQGLSQADEQYELKSSLLEAILHANLELAACSTPRTEA